MKFRSKVSFIIISFFLGAIIVSFALTGFNGVTTSGDSVGAVDGNPIKIDEYSRALNQNIQRFSSFFGGKPLTAEQIRSFRVKESTLNSLVEQKLVQNLADKMEINVSELEIKDAIKAEEYFLTNNVFDVNKYKGLLSANRLSPAIYEKMTKDRLQLEKVYNIFSNLGVSKKYVSEILKLKSNSAKIHAVQIERESLSKFVPVEMKAINEFVKDEKNMPVLEALYKSMSAEFNKPEEIKARHILIKGDDEDSLNKAKSIRNKVNLNNFSTIANKETEDPSGKDKGGDLGWFSRGKMVPEFENAAFAMKKGEISQPIKSQFGYHIIVVDNKKEAITKSFDAVKSTLAKRHLQKTNRKGLEDFVNNLQKQIENAFTSNNTKEIENLQKKYEFEFIKNSELNLYDLKVGSLQFKDKDLQNIFKTREVGALITDLEPPYLKMLKVISFASLKDSETSLAKNLETEFKAQNDSFATNFRQSLLEELQNKASIVTYPQML
jgi:peptidyl-prolyl cis-trans isomerase D